MYRHGEWDEEYEASVFASVREEERAYFKQRAKERKARKDAEKEIVLQKTLELFKKPNFRSPYSKDIRLKVIMEYEFGVKGKDCASLSKKYGIPFYTIRKWVRYGVEK